jgi:Fic-DOC domain mobile mystery protein B
MTDSRVVMKFTYPPGATPIDPDETAGLIPSHITSQRELNEWEEVNILEATFWARSQRNKDVLSLEFIRRVHLEMFNHTWKWAGQFRTTLKNIGVPPHRIQEDLVNLCADTKHWRANHTFPDVEIAVLFHHRLVSIHPFSNGNGRHARLMADLLMTRTGGSPFSWGRANLTAPGAVRRKYIAALQAADRHDTRPLLEFAQS